MPIYRPSELTAYLESLGASPKKHLSQNFLLDGNIIRKIVALADLQPDDLVVEIGPGPGALTEELLRSGATVLAVEKDKVLAKGLEQLKKQYPKLTVFCDDILKFPLESEVAKHLKKDQKAKIIANLPYHLTTPIITQFLPLHTLLSKIVVMVQEEVARRFAAPPATKEYGSITVFLQFYSTPKYGFKISRNCFYPKPKVESALVRFDLKPPPPVSSEKQFFILTRTAFNQRRKMLRTSLKDLYDKQHLEDALKTICFPPTARPEELGLEDFLRLFEELSHDKKFGMIQGRVATWPCRSHREEREETRRELRSMNHAKDSNLAVVGIVVCNECCLFLKRNFPPLNWSPPAGRVHVGEDPVQGLKREVLEETGLQVKVLKPVGTWKGKHQGNDISSISYVCLADSQKVILSPEHSDFQWIPIANLLDIPIDTDFQTSEWPALIMHAMPK